VGGDGRGEHDASRNGIGLRAHTALRSRGWATGTNRIIPVVGEFGVCVASVRGELAAVGIARKVGDVAAFRGEQVFALTRGCRQQIASAASVINAIEVEPLVDGFDDPSTLARIDPPLLARIDPPLT
jgi:hypothetical protein